MSTNPRLLNNTRNYRRGYKGLLTNDYHKQIERSKKHGWPMPSYTLREFQNKWLIDDKFLNLFIEWTASGCDHWRKPSFDRIDPLKPYTTENVQVMTWFENRRKGDGEVIITRCTQVYQLNLNGEAIRKYDSVQEAVLLTGCNQGLIVECCQHKRNQTGGFKWMYGIKHRCKDMRIYENPELLEEQKK